MLIYNAENLQRSSSIFVRMFFCEIWLYRFAWATYIVLRLSKLDHIRLMKLPQKLSVEMHL